MNQFEHMRRAVDAAKAAQNEINALGAGPQPAKRKVGEAEYTIDGVKDIRETAEGGLLVEFTAGIDEVSLELTAQQFKELRNYLYPPIRSTRYSPQYADERVLNLLVDPTRGVPPGSFLTQLIQCIQAADPENRERLRVGFAEFVDAVERWQRGELA